MNNFFFNEMQIIVHLALTNYQRVLICNQKNAKTTRKFLTKNLQIDMTINEISVISTNNKLLFMLIFVIDDTSFYKTYVIKSILYLISLIQLGE